VENVPYRTFKPDIFSLYKAIKRWRSRKLLINKVFGVINVDVIMVGKIGCVNEELPLKKPLFFLLVFCWNKVGMFYYMF
jgi:hypothetical protein